MTHLRTPLKHNLLGILGGMGPLASAEFVKTLYQYNTQEPEQLSPACILLSDPSFPDRTEAIITGLDSHLVAHLERLLESLCSLGADKIVLTCFTTHYFLPRLPMRFRDKIISLVDLVIEEIQAKKTRALLLCTIGTYTVGLFKSHPEWSTVEPYVIIPTESDQTHIHQLIYHIKECGFESSALDSVGSLLRKYQVDTFIAGCTELHFLTKAIRDYDSGYKSCQFIDPLQTLAENFQRIFDSHS